MLPSTRYAAQGAALHMGICCNEIKMLAPSLPEPVEGGSLISTIGVAITGFHFIIPCAFTGSPGRTLGQRINHRIRSKGQSSDV